MVGGGGVELGLAVAQLGRHVHACIVMAYVVMAYIVMACTIMAYIAMAGVVCMPKSVAVAVVCMPTQLQPI